MTFITSGRSEREKTKIKNVKKKKIRVWAVVLWLAVWELTARLIGQEILLVSPVVVLGRCITLAGTADFWRSIAFSFCRITGGFLLALLAGTVLAAISAACRIVKELMAPMMAVIRTTPVASFIILILIWISSRNLSVIISFLMVLPIVYGNVLQGIESTDRQLLEMAKVFRVPFFRRFRYIYVSEVMPHFMTAASVASGLCWKAGVAAEVIGIPDGSIGEKLYEAKVYLETPDLFAWTFVIILLSVCFEKLFTYGMNKVWKRIEGGRLWTL